MTRYIIVDNYTGFIWGDSVDFPKEPDDILSVCRMLDDEIGSYEHGITYEKVSYFNGEFGYLVYDASIPNGNKIPTSYDGQDQEIIDTVTNNCTLLGYVAREQKRLDSI